jgi:hypothetical protein
MYVLRGLRRGTAGRTVSELRRRTGSPPGAAGGQAGSPSCINEAGAEAAGLQSRLIPMGLRVAYYIIPAQAFGAAIHGSSAFAKDDTGDADSSIDGGDKGWVERL